MADTVNNQPSGSLQLQARILNAQVAAESEEILEKIYVSHARNIFVIICIAALLYAVILCTLVELKFVAIQVLELRTCP